ncbi:MAG: cytidylate kinase, partial [Deltaproteobacteria bacterium]|nr:cytidylate kinase [Deltaproteobacteria bacterium]
ADFKFFITASPEVRARRRYEERTARNEKTAIEEVEADIKKRDEQDQSRKLAPLKPAGNAIIIDTSDMGIEKVIELMLSHVKGKAI